MFMAGAGGGWLFTISITFKYDFYNLKVHYYCLALSAGSVPET